MFNKGESIIDQLNRMRAKMADISKKQDEADAYNMIDQGDSFDAVRARLRAGYEISHLEVSDDVFQKLANMTANRDVSPMTLFNGIDVKRYKGIGAGKMRIALVKSKPRTPNTRDYAAHTDYTPTAHGYIDMCDMSCV